MQQSSEQVSQEKEVERGGERGEEAMERECSGEQKSQKIRFNAERQNLPLRLHALIITQPEAGTHSPSHKE